MIIILELELEIETIVKSISHPDPTHKSPPKVEPKIYTTKKGTRENECTCQL